MDYGLVLGRAAVLVLVLLAMPEAFGKRDSKAIGVWGCGGTFFAFLMGWLN